MKRKFKGIWIPSALWLCEELSIQEKCLLAEVDSLNADGDGCYASNAYLAKFFGLSAERLRKVIADLNRRGWLRVELLKGKIGIDRTLFPGAKWTELEAPSMVGNDQTGMVESNHRVWSEMTGPNKEITKKDNKAKANAIAEDLFPDSINTQDSETKTGKIQSRLLAARLENEAKAEVILASYPRTGTNYKRDKLATVRALKKCAYSTLLQAVKNYAAHIVAQQIESKYVCLACNFMDKERYLEDWTNVPTSGQSAPVAKPKVKIYPSMAERWKELAAQKEAEERRNGNGK